MGTGKSTIGRIAAQILKFQFLDTDQAIEAHCGMSVRTMFETQGEAAFRQAERELLTELAKLSGTVIATGGGLPAQEGNLAALKTHALVVCLWAGPEAIYERVRAHTHRPLLNNPNPLAKIQELLAAREPFYKQADVLVSTELRSPREVAMHVAHQFQDAASAGK